MKRIFVLLLLILIVSTSMVFAGGGSESSDDSSMDGMSGSDIAVAMVTDVGGVNDQSFNQSAWEGLQQAGSDFGVKVSYVESNQEADYGPNFETVVEAGNDLVWGIGFLMAGALLDTATLNPAQNYAIIDIDYGADTPPNVVGVMFRAQEPSFMVGYIAGKMTETGTVGFVGGISGVIIDQFHYGYLAGVKYANPDVEVLIQYADSFVDAAAGKSIANQMYAQGADIVFHAAGGVGFGVIEAAKEQNKWAIGVDRDQNSLAPDNVLTSAMKRVNMATYAVIQDLVNGNFKGGQTVNYGLEEGAVGIAPTSSKHVPSDILAEVDEIAEKIISGEITVPYNEMTYNQ